MAPSTQMAQMTQMASSTQDAGPLRQSDSFGLRGLLANTGFQDDLSSRFTIGGVAPHAPASFFPASNKAGFPFSSSSMQTGSPMRGANFSG
jgi:hypothetical protein